MTARSFIAVLVTSMVAAAVSFATPAEASDCGQAVLKAWDNGRLDASYPPTCYRKALQELPEDIRIYSSAEDDINRALIASVARHSNVSRATQSDGSVKGIVRTLAGTAPAKSVRRQAAAAADDPNANTVPLTVLISAAGALVLVAAAGVSVVARRLRRHAAS